MRMKIAAALTVAGWVAFGLTAWGQVYPLPSWYFYGGGTAANGTWNGSSTSPDNATLVVTCSSPPQAPTTYVSAVANSCLPVLVIEPRATYTLTFSANVNGLAHGNAFLVNGYDTSAIAGVAVQGSGWKNYTNTFTTGGTSDPNVGMNLYVQLALTGQGSSVGTTTATFTNVQLKVLMPRPTLTISRASFSQFELRWPTNFDWCSPESADDLLATDWDSLTNTRTTQGNQFVVPVSPEAGQRFFRLRVQ
jgi:hypothetical protein